MRLPGDLDLETGQIRARMESLSALPAFSAGTDEGRIIFVTAGLNQGFWFGAQDGSSSFQRLSLGTTLAQYDLLSQAVNNGVTTQLTASATGIAAQTAFLAEVVLASGDITSGQVRVEMYNDSARTDRFYDATFEMSSLSPDRLPVFFSVDNVNGDIYINVTNNSGANGSVDISLQAAGVVLVQTAAPPGNGSGINAGVAGDGISFDNINARLDVDLLVNGGLELVGTAGSREVRVDLDSVSDTIEVNIGQGLRVNPLTVLINTTDQLAIAGTKQFDQPAYTPAASPGAPTTGAHIAGEWHLDSNLDLFQCITGGTPGTWIFWGWKETSFGGAANGTSYTGTALANGGTVVLEVPTTGRRGFIRKMNIWAADPAFGNTDIDVPFRIRCYPNENLEGREQLWSVLGMGRRTFVTTGVSSGVSLLEVNTVGTTNLDDLVRLRQIAGPLEEFQRVTVRETTPIRLTFDETLVNSLAINDQVMFVTEFIDLPWRNNSGNPSESQKIFLEFVNDDLSGGTDLVFGYEILFEEMGGGQPL